MSTHLINKTSYTISVFPKSIAPGTEHDYDKIAEIPFDSIFILKPVATDDNWTTLNVQFAQPVDGVAEPKLINRTFQLFDGWIYNFGSATPSVYEGAYGSTQTVHLQDLNQDITGQVFEIRRDTSGVLLDSQAANGYIDGLNLSKGDQIMVIDGKASDALPLFLKIKAFKAGGIWYSFGNDTRIGAIDTGATYGLNTKESANVFATNW